ncbi:MAG: hypothetical protein IT290_01455, partial [Deltaproteobacteria bacterium]|nr:hypothetical protein [Deltaproteobacteria bacterium]
MTLIATIPASDGIIIATDSVLAAGGVRDRTQKIVRLTNKICWAGTGELPLIQRFAQQLAAFEDSPQTLKELLPSLTNILRSTVRELLAYDYRTDVYANNPNAIAQLHRADFLFAEWSNGVPYSLHLNTFGSPQWFSDRPFFVGPGDVFAGWLHQKYKGATLTTKSGVSLGYRIVEEAIDTGWYGLGGSPDVWQITDAGVKQLAESDARSMKDR